MQHLHKILSAFFAMALFVALTPLQAQAESGVRDFKPGALKSALASGKPVLLHYKTKW